MNLVRNFSKHSSSNSEIIVKECGGLDAILTCMKDFDITVREAALQAISSIIRQDANIAQFVVNSGINSYSGVVARRGRGGISSK